MKTLEQIKNDYAVDLGYEDWESLMIEVCYFNNEEFFKHENEVMVLVQKECLENAWNVFLNNDVSETLEKELIKDENNIIK